MGRQLRFLASPSDLVDLLGEIERRDGWAVVAETPRGTATALIRPSTVDVRDEVAIWVGRLADLGTIAYEPDASGLETISTIGTQAIEFSAFVADRGEPRSGRLWYETGWYVNDLWQSFPADFLSWADRLLAVVRRRWTRVESMSYAGPEALGLIRRDRSE